MLLSCLTARRSKHYLFSLWLQTVWIYYTLLITVKSHFIIFNENKTTTTNYLSDKEEKGIYKERNEKQHKLLQKAKRTPTINSLYTGILWKNTKTIHTLNHFPFTIFLLQST